MDIFEKLFVLFIASAVAMLFTLMIFLVWLMLNPDAYRCLNQ